MGDHSVLYLSQRDGSTGDGPSTSGSANLDHSTLSAASSVSPGARRVHRSASSSDIGDDFGRDEGDDAIFLDSSIHETRSLNEADGVLGK